MPKTKKFRFESFDGFVSYAQLTRERALKEGAKMVAWSQTPDEEPKPPAEPRLWVGEDMVCVNHWAWHIIDGESHHSWELSNEGHHYLRHIFAPPTGSKPVGDPTKLDSLPLCREVDWETVTP